jgi:hypothetical protein
MKVAACNNSTPRQLGLDFGNLWELAFKHFRDTGVKRASWSRGEARHRPSSQAVKRGQSNGKGRNRRRCCFFFSCSSIYEARRQLGSDGYFGFIEHLLHAREAPTQYRISD